MICSYSFCLQKETYVQSYSKIKLEQVLKGFVKAADGKMSFIMVNSESGKVIDMYSPYITLIQKMFPNAKIIIDIFHLTQLISSYLNKPRIIVMKNDKKNYNKF